MNDHDRFAEFLRREGVSYHAPPKTPSDAMWARVSVRMDAGAYNAPPPAPREEMWERIEAAWSSGPSAGSTAAKLAAGHAAARPAAAEPTGDPVRLPGRWTRKRINTGWAVGLAAAASLVLGLMLGRNYDGPGAGVTDGPAADPAAVATTGPNPPPAVVELVDRDRPATVVELESVLPADPRESTPAVVVADAPPAETPAAFAGLVQPAAAYETTRHLDRAATLLTAFRIDQGTPTSLEDLARWARELLGDTRMYLDMEVPRSPLERALLEDLELVLLQISRLGPGAPDFERQLALESMEWKGTLTRLRAASATGDM